MLGNHCGVIAGASVEHGDQITNYLLPLYDTCDHILYLIKLILHKGLVRELKTEKLSTNILYYTLNNCPYAANIFNQSHKLAHKSGTY